MAINLKMPIKKHIYPVSGIQLAFAEAGIKYKRRNDIALILADEGSHVSGVFSKNKFIAAPVIQSKKNLLVGPNKRALIINTGSANAGTGEIGLIDAQKTCDLVASKFNLKEDEVLPFSTGVIMTYLPMDKIKDGISKLPDQLSSNHWVEVAKTIMTTDTVPKVYSKKIELDNEEIVVTGIAKGSGMIHPDMATMLAFIATNASISNNLIEKIIKDVTEDTFNLISIDGDTSTNDSFLLISTNKSKNIITDEKKPNYKKLYDAIYSVAKYLSQSIVRDGEGATKFVEIEISNGKSRMDCKEIAKKISHSPLVKTAFFASDPNIGRILAAIGNANISKLDISKVDLYLNNYLVVKSNSLVSNYDENMAKKEMSKKEFTLKVDLNAGSESLCFYTTDLSHDYVKINAEYRT